MKIHQPVHGAILPPYKNARRKRGMGSYGLLSAATHANHGSFAVRRQVDGSVRKLGDFDLLSGVREARRAVFVTRP
jgi:hypothetical protein